MKRVLVITSVASMIAQFIVPNLILLQELGYEVKVVCNFNEGNTCDEQVIESLKIKLSNLKINYSQVDFARNVFCLRQNNRAYQKVFNILINQQYDFIHCHSPIGGLVGRIAGQKTNTKVIYTAHGFHFYKGAPLVNWLLYYPIEKYLAKLTDILITINVQDYELAKKKLHAKKIKYLPGIGLDTKKYLKNFNRDTYISIREKIGLDESSFLLLSIGELSKRKNHIDAVNAMKLLDLENIIYCICGKGKKEELLSKVILSCGMKNNVKLLGYRSDLKEICAVTDVFLFPSLQEGLPVGIMEAMASGLPVICSNIRGNNDLIINGRGGFLINKGKWNSEFPEFLKMLIKNKDMRKSMGEFNQERIKRFDLQVVNSKMREIYKLILDSEKFSIKK